MSENVNDGQAAAGGQVAADGGAGGAGGDAGADTVLFNGEGQGQSQGQPQGQSQGQQQQQGQQGQGQNENSKDSGVPIDGKYDLKMPEGIELDQDLAAAFAPEFKELGLTNAQAQKLADKYIEAQTKRMEAQGQEWGKIISAWVDEARADKEIGGAKWDGTLATARRAIAQFGTPELADYLNASGGGNHVEMIRFMAKVGAMLGDDKPAQGNMGAPGRADASRILFPNEV